VFSSNNYLLIIILLYEIG